MSSLLQLPSLQEVEDELAYRHLNHFIRHLWSTVETDTYLSNWHQDAICAHLDAVLKGTIRRLIINIPPRCMKSLAVSVFFPAWAWLRYPQLRFLFSSYAHTLSIRDSVKCRRVMSSPTYQRLMMKYQPKLRLSDDQNAKERYDNSMGGYRLATSVGGSNTGEGGDIIGVDDPNNVIQSESETIREGTNQWWDEAMSTRLNDPKTGRYIIIMQRTHTRDLTGHILAKQADLWDHLCLPAEYEGDRVVSSLDYVDPRTTFGESLWPARLTPEVLAGYKSALTSYAYAGQFQQRPAPRDGGMFNTKKILLVDHIKETDIIHTVRYWDKAGTKGGEGAQTAGVKMAKLRSGMWGVLDVVTGRWEAGEREAMITRTAQADGQKVRIYVEQEPGSGGKESAQYTTRRLAGYRIRADRPTGDKTTRAEPFSDQVYGGNVVCLRRGWTTEYLDELKAFPRGALRDQVDASSGAFAKLRLIGSGVVMMS